MCTDPPCRRPSSWSSLSAGMEVFSSDGPDGGHLAAQRACIAEGSKVLWRCPPGGVAPDGTFGTSLLGENGRRHLDYLVARGGEASYAMPEVLVGGEVKQRLIPPSPSRWAPQIALEIRSPYEDETKRLRDFLRELWRHNYGEPVPEIQGWTELQPTEDLADLAGVADGILLAAVGKPNASVTAQVMILKSPYSSSWTSRRSGACSRFARRQPLRAY